MIREIKFTALLLFISLVFFQGCYVKRLSRPQLEGYVFDKISKQAIEGVQVEEVKTNDKGFYRLEARYFREFTWIGMEASPLFLNLYITKDGYKPAEVKSFHHYGSAMSDTTPLWKMDAVYLNRK